MATDATDAERFLTEALNRGLIRPADADSCRRVLSVLAEVHVDLGVGDVVVRKGLLDREQVGEIKRALARRKIGRYEVLERLGSGGNGVVWRARDSRLGRIVALKVLARPRDATDVLSSYVARFEREARTAVTLNHVNIVRGLDFGESDGYVYFAMEFVAGETASERVRREGRMSEREAVRVALQVVEALRHVQRFGLVHRDLKPDNLLLTPTGEVKVCDLGLAKPTIEESSRLASRGVIAGTPLYMAPEQVRDPDSVDWRTDVYGLGATLYHLLTGRPPFVPRSGTSVIQRHLEEPVVDPREHVLELSAGITSVVLKMLGKRPEDRYETLDGLGEDLAAVLDGRPPTHALELSTGQERPVTSLLAETNAAHRRRRAPRRRWAVAVGSVAVAATVIGVAALVWPPAPSDPNTVAWPHADPGVEPSAEPGGQSGPEDPREAGSPDPRSPGPRVEVVDPGRAALLVGRELDASGASSRERIRHYSSVAADYAAFPSGKSAASRLAELRAELAAEADAELERRMADAQRLVAAGEYGRAAELLNRFPPEYQSAPAHDAALQESIRLVRAGRELVDRSFDEARIACAEWRFQAARDAIGRIRAAGTPGSETKRSQAQLELELAQLSHDKEREENASAFHLLAGRALIASRADHEIALRDVLAAARDPGLRTYRQDLEALAEWIPLAETAHASVAEGWMTWTRAGRQVSVRMAGVGAQDVGGVPAGVDGGLLLIGSDGDASRGVRLDALGIEALREALSAGAPDTPDADVDTLVAALLLACRRPADAASAGAPAEWVEAVRAVAIDQADARISAAGRVGRSPIEAREILDDVVADVPWYGQAYRARALLLERLGDLDGAIRDLEAAIQNSERPGAERIDLARILERRGRLSDAQGHLRLFLDSRDAASSARLAEAEEALRRVADAKVERLVEVHRRDARNALRRGRGDEAMRPLESILELRPEDPWALFEAGRLHAQRGAVFAAFRLLRRLVVAHPDDRYAVSAQRELAALERYRAGVPAGRDAMEAGRRALAADDLAEAVSRQRTALRLSPFLVDAHLGLAEALLERGLRSRGRDDLVAARSGASDALLLAPDYAAAMVVRARAALALDDAEAALRDAELAAATLPDPSVALIVAGRALLELGRLDEAYTRMQEAFERRRHADPVFWQALILERRGERREARHRLDFLYDELGGAPEHLREECEALYLRLRD